VEGATRHFGPAARDVRLGLILLWYAVRPAPPRLDEFLETRF